MTVMSKPSWTPETATPEQLRLRQAAVDAFKRAGQSEAEGYEYARLAHAAGVPMEDLAKVTKKGRSTLFRRIKDELAGASG